MLIHTSEISSDANRIAEFLNRNSSSFIPSLNSRVDLIEYSNKLSQKAVNIFICCGENDVGHGAIYINSPPNAYLSSFCIDLMFRKLGFCDVLLFEIISICSKNLIEYINLDVSVKNDIAQNFYLSRGFFITQSRCDVVLMKKCILDGMLI